MLAAKYPAGATGLIAWQGTLITETQVFGNIAGAKAAEHGRCNLKEIQNPV